MPAQHCLPDTCLLETLRSRAVAHEIVATRLARCTHVCFMASAPAQMRPLGTTRRCAYAPSRVQHPAPTKNTNATRSDCVRSWLNTLRAADHDMPRRRARCELARVAPRSSQVWHPPSFGHASKRTMASSTGTVLKRNGGPCLIH